MVIMVKKVEDTPHIHIPVDEWDTDKYPIEDKDRIFINTKGEIKLPVAELLYHGDQEYKQLDSFIMNSKRSYNSDETRTHICRYLNYFEKYYDYDRELLMIIAQMKLTIDYNRDYCKSNFMDDINRYIIRNKRLGRKVKRFVDDNYLMELSSNNNKTPNLQFENKHAKVLYEISLLMNMYIPLATHYMYIHMIKNADIQSFMLELFDLCNTKYEEEYGIHIYNKLYETATSVVNKSKNPDRPLWEKNAIRGINTTTHTKDSVIDIILQIMPKYSYSANIINFNYYSNRQCLRYKITDISYEFPFIKLSSSKRDADQNSEFDRFEARLNKKDEALSLQNKVAAEQTIKRIEAVYGPFSNEEIEHYRKRLTEDGRTIINPFQFQMVGYMFFKEFGDPISMKAIKNQTDYIKLVIAAKRALKESGMVILPYIISSKITRIATRKNVNKKEVIRIENSEIYAVIENTYKNPKIKQRILDLIGKIISSQFEIIDFDQITNQPTIYDKQIVPIINDMIVEEVLFFINHI